MSVNPNHDEALEELWMLLEDGDDEAVKAAARLQRLPESVGLQEMTDAGYIESKGDRISFTGLGRELASSIIRRHRLAERLLTDVLGMEEVEGQACKFEHILSEEAADRICTLLGHPHECPHGLAIPPGNCCRQTRETVDSLITTVDRLKMGEEAAVAYLEARSDERLHKLISFGLHPGAMVRLTQRYPSVVIRTEETQLAVEEDVAAGIYVRRGGER